MLLVEKQQRGGRQLLHLRVNFSPDLIEVWKAVRTMKSLDLRPSFKLMNLAHHVNGLYPFAVSLIQSVRDYDATNNMVAAQPGADILVANFRQGIHKLFLDVSSVSLCTKYSVHFVVHNMFLDRPS